jgi:hypothetical protein
MANDPQFHENRARLWSMTVTGMTLGIWGMVEESSTSLAPKIGAHILEVMETSMGRKVDSQKPDEVIRQLSALFINTFGYAADAKVESAEKQIRVLFSKPVNAPEFVLLEQRGVKRDFSHPFMCAGMAALARLGQKARWTTAVDPAGGSELITFDLF